MEQPHVAITGANGRLGISLIDFFDNLGWKITQLERSNFDLSEPDSLPAVLQELVPDILLNTAGMTDVDGCENQKDLATCVNAEAPFYMATACKELGTRFVHISTDYVFKGEESKILDETDPANPISWYGISKRDGELRVIDANPESLIIRISWLYGPGKPAFPDWIIKQAMEKKEVAAVSDKISSPTSADDLCGWIFALLEKTNASGIFHLANGGSCSWQEYGQEALDIATRLGMELKSTEVGAIPLADLTSFVAKRPKFTALDTTKFQQTTGVTPRSWQIALSDYLEQHLK